MLKQIPRQSRYTLAKHVEVKALEAASGSGASARAAKRWHTLAKASGDTRTFPERLEESLAARKKDTVFIDSALQRMHDTRDLLALTAAHIGQNLVRIGKKYYRQRSGIPQGSVLSSMLCNYFYADLERNHLGFLLRADDCLLLRLIDDFLLITTDRAKAAAFVRTMYAGLPRYGVTVSPEKSLVNFALTVRGVDVPRLGGGGDKFPYCGLLIDCRSLAVSKRRDGLRDSGQYFSRNKLKTLQGHLTIELPGIFNSLTVEFSRCPGQNFKRKVISKGWPANPSPSPPLNNFLVRKTADNFGVQPHQTPSRSSPTSCSSTRRSTRARWCSSTSMPPLPRRRPRCGRMHGAWAPPAGRARGC